MALKKLDEIHFVILTLEKKGLVNRINAKHRLKTIV